MFWVKQVFCFCHFMGLSLFFSLFLFIIVTYFDYGLVIKRMWTCWYGGKEQRFYFWRKSLTQICSGGHYLSMIVPGHFEVIMFLLLMAGQNSEIPCGGHSFRCILQSIGWAFYSLFPRAGSKQSIHFFYILLPEFAIKWWKEFYFTTWAYSLALLIPKVTLHSNHNFSSIYFLIQVDRLIGRNHLFKRSIILIKAWCYYESRILGAHHGLISTYALETLVLYIFHLYHSSLWGPLVVTAVIVHCNLQLQSSACIYLFLMIFSV